MRTIGRFVKGLVSLLLVAAALMLFFVAVGKSVVAESTGEAVAGFLPSVACLTAGVLLNRVGRAAELERAERRAEAYAREQEARWGKPDEDGSQGPRTFILPGLGNVAFGLFLFVWLSGQERKGGPVEVPRLLAGAYRAGGSVCASGPFVAIGGMLVVVGVAKWVAGPPRRPTRSRRRRSDARGEQDDRPARRSDGVVDLGRYMDDPP